MGVSFDQSNRRKLRAVARVKNKTCGTVKRTIPTTFHLLVGVTACQVQMSRADALQGATMVWTMATPQQPSDVEPNG